MEDSDLRVMKTKRAIRQALKKLAQETDYSLITVTAISREAAINRKTFYAHYGTVDDVLCEVYEEDLSLLCKDALSSVSEEDPTFGLRALTISLLKSLDENMHGENNLVRNFGMARAITMLIEPLEKIISDEREKRHLRKIERLHQCVTCYVGCLIAVFSDWVQHDKQEPLGQIADQICFAAIGGIPALL